jgi:DNA-binding PadR family transcriptional regulator
MFLETWHSHGEPQVGLFRRTKAGKVEVHEVLRNREELLGAILALVDGELTTFNQDDRVTELTIQDPEQRYFRVAFETGA